jgi:hypothetical protein
MTTECSPDGLSCDDQAVYRIRVDGRVPAHWSGRLSGMSVTAKSAGAGRWVTTLVGRLDDQADLIGVLNTLYMLQLPVLGVERVRG